jgi:predicted transcriptional regulator
MSLHVTTEFDRELSQMLEQIEKSGREQVGLLIRLLEVNAERSYLGIRQVSEMPDNYARRIREIQQYELLESELSKIQRDCSSLQFNIDMSVASIKALRGGSSV